MRASLGLALVMCGCKRAPQPQDRPSPVPVSSPPASVAASAAPPASATPPASAPSPRRPLSFHRVILGARDSDAAADYLIVLAELANGGVSAHVSFASGKPRDEFLVELTPNALAEARAVLTIEQGNDHLVEEPTWLDAGRGTLRASRVDATTLPFLP